MGKTDYYTIVAKILVYLYKKYKCMDIPEGYISAPTKDFPIPGEQLDKTISMMLKQDLIDGAVLKAWGGDIVSINYSSLEITPGGIDYLQENKKIRKICEGLKEAVPIAQLFFPL